MIKIISTLLKGFGLNLNTILLVLLIGTGVYFGWSYSNRGQKVKDLTAELKGVREELGAERLKSESLDRVLVEAKDRIRQDSLYTQKTIADFQSIIKTVREQQKKAEGERNEALAGILCWKVNLFGKKKLVKCDDL